MNKILLESAVVDVRGGKTTRKDILIGNGKFLKIADKVSAEDSIGCEVVDCTDFAALPAFYNGHTHAAMTLLRGYADDMELSRWLNEYIWPFEAKLTDEDIEIASRLAVLEMIKSGTVFFSDMYWHREWTMKVVEEMGIRATIGVTISDMLTPPDELEENFAFLAALLAKVCGSAETLPAHEALEMATSKVAETYGINAGTIAEGKLADCLLVNLKNERMVPCHDLISNWVYAADSECIDSVICNGKFVMRNRHVDGEEEILKEAAACAARLTR